MNPDIQYHRDAFLWLSGRGFPHNDTDDTVDAAAWFESSMAMSDREFIGRIRDLASLAAVAMPDRTEALVSMIGHATAARLARGDK